jgi:hypothetical protein
MMSIGDQSPRPLIARVEVMQIGDLYTLPGGDSAHYQFRTDAEGNGLLYLNGELVRTISLKALAHAMGCAMSAEDLAGRTDLDSRVESYETPN